MTAPPVANFSASSYSIGEAGVTATLTVTLSAGAQITGTVHYATANGTATAGSDYTASGGTLTFAPGVTVATIQVPILPDNLDESNETVIVTLSNGNHVTPGTARNPGHPHHRGRRYRRRMADADYGDCHRGW